MTFLAKLTSSSGDSHARSAKWGQQAGRASNEEGQEGTWVVWCGVPHMNRQNLKCRRCRDVRTDSKEAENAPDLGPKLLTKVIMLHTGLASVGVACGVPLG